MLLHKPETFSEGLCPRVYSSQHPVPPMKPLSAQLDLLRWCWHIWIFLLVGNRGVNSILISQPASMISSQPWLFKDFKLTVLLENICKQVSSKLQCPVLNLWLGSGLCNRCPLGWWLASRAARDVDRNVLAPMVTSSKRLPGKNSHGEGMQAEWRYSLIIPTAAPGRSQRAGWGHARWCHFPMSWQAFRSCFWCMAGRGPWQHSGLNWNWPSIRLPTEQIF